MTKKPSKKVIDRRLRNRIIEYFELVSSAELQKEYQAQVPYISVSNELFNQWDDWVPYQNPGEHFSEPVFSEAEQEAIVSFHATLNSISNKMPDQLPSLEDFICSLEWKELRQAAKRAFCVFIERGKLPED